MNTLILAAAMLGLLIGVAYTLFKPRWAMLFVLVLYPLEQLLTTTSSFFSQNTKFLNLLVGGLAVLGAISTFLNGSRPWRGYFNPIWITTILLYIWGIIGILFNPDPSLGLADLNKGYPYLGLLLFFPPLLINSLDDFRRLILPMMIVGSAIIVLILLSPNTSMSGDRLGVENASIGGSKILNPLATAGMGGMLAMFGMLYRTERRSIPVLVIRFGAIGIGLTMAMLSGSRGQLMGAILCGVLMYPFARQIRDIGQFIIVSGSAFLVIVFIAIVLNLATTGDVANRYNSSALTSSIGVRQAMITTMLTEWLGNPVAMLQGLGTSSFSYYWQTGNETYPHNLPVHILTENGLIGAALLILILLMVARSGLRLLSTFRESPSQLATAAILVAMCMYELLISLKQGNWFPSATPFWTFLILAKIDARVAVDLREHQLLPADGYGYDEYDYGYEDQDATAHAPG